MLNDDYFGMRIVKLNEARDRCRKLILADEPDIQKIRGLLRQTHKISFMSQTYRSYSRILVECVMDFVLNFRLKIIKFKVGSFLNTVIISANKKRLPLTRTHA